MSDPKQPEEKPAAEASEPQTPATGSGEVLESLLQYAKPVLLGICGAIVVVSLVIGYKTHRQNKLEQAADQLWSAKTVQDLETVTETGSSSTAALALLKAAKRYCDTQRYDLAMKKYSEFQTRFPAHELINVAEMGKLHCIEARGQFQEAIEGFVAFAKAHPKHFLTAQALLGEARCLGEMGRIPEAKARCEEFIVAHAQSPWKEHAEDLLKNLGRLANRPLMPPPMAPSAAPVSYTVPIPSDMDAPSPAPAAGATNAAGSPQIKLDLGLPTAPEQK